jgi:hypothetical protein
LLGKTRRVPVYVSQEGINRYEQWLAAEQAKVKQELPRAAQRVLAEGEDDDDDDDDKDDDKDDDDEALAEDDKGPINYDDIGYEVDDEPPW